MRAAQEVRRKYQCQSIWICGKLFAFTRSGGLKEVAVLM